MPAASTKVAIAAAVIAAVAVIYMRHKRATFVPIPMLTCDTLLRGARADALLLLSGSRIAFDEWEAPLAAGRAQGLPVLVSHGEADADLSFEAGVALRDALASAGAEVSWVPFGQGHEIPLVVWRKVRTFLKQRLGPGPR